MKNRQLYLELGIREYYWFDPDSHLLEALELDVGTGAFQPRAPKPNGRHGSAGLGAGVEVGVEQGNIGLYYQGAFIPRTTDLLAQAERHLADERNRREEAERQQADERSRREEAEALLARAKERLRQLGEEP